MAKKNNGKGARGFEDFYQEVFKDRWAPLKEALLSPKKHIAFKNSFCKNNLMPKEASSLEAFEGIYIKEDEWNPSPIDEEGRPAYYLMDLASVLAPQALNIQEGEKVLDLCAAPGGKSLILASALANSGELTSNDRSRDRRGRLKKVLNDYLPDNLIDRVQVTGHDATSWCLHETEAYDKILLDAPCSSERHVLESSKYLEQWSKKRTKSLAITQWAMLASAFEVLKTGGRLVYSTCALSPLENDQVIEKLLNKRGERVKLINEKFPIGEATEFGWEVLPDKTNWGPFYLSIIEKVDAD